MIAWRKHIYYQDHFLDKHLEQYLRENNINRVDQIDPNEFVQWIFPKSIQHRKPLYKSIADNYGYTLNAHAITEVSNESDVINLLAETIKHAQ